jgi:hypothetical protein
VLAAYPQVDALAGAEAAFLPFDRGDSKVWDLAAGDAGFNKLVELQGGGGEIIDLGMPVAHDVGMLAHGIPPF